MNDGRDRAKRSATLSRKAIDGLRRMRDVVRVAQLHPDESVVEACAWVDELEQREATSPREGADCDV